MLENIVKNVTNRTPQDIDEMRSSGLPLLMYGAGSYAIDVVKFLSQRGVELEAYVVDDGYRAGNTDKKDKRVLSMSEARALYSHANVIIGIADHVTARKKLASWTGVKQVFFIDAPDRTEFFDYDYFREHLTEFTQTYDWLSDKRSQQILAAFINAKISGDPEGLYKFTEFNQYFPPEISLTNEEVFIDCGAFDGDTIAEFIKQARGRYRKIYALEPDRSNFELLQRYIDNERVVNCDALQLGAWDRKTTLKFAASGSVTSTVSDSGEVSIQVDKLDSLIHEGPVTFIKMDIEGAELGALKGAQRIIKQDKPKLAICVYHKPEDLVTIPQFIKGLRSDYSFFLRQHQYVSWDMVLYAI